MLSDLVKGKCVCNVAYRDSFLTQVCQSADYFNRRLLSKSSVLQWVQQYSIRQVSWRKARVQEDRPFFKKGLNRLKLLIKGAKKSSYAAVAQ